MLDLLQLGVDDEAAVALVRVQVVVVLVPALGGPEGARVAQLGGDGLGGVLRRGLREHRLRHGAL